MECSKCLSDVLTEKQLYHILNEVSAGDCQLVGSEVSPACQGLSGFLGDHYKVKLRVKGKDTSKEICIFVKQLPQSNKPKAEFIHNKKFYFRESLMFKYIGETGAAEVKDPWCAKAYMHDDNILVMPDLSVEGYRVQSVQEYLDLDHILVTARSLARFHATIANLFTRKTKTKSQSEALHSDLEISKSDPIFKDSPWLRAAAKLTANFFKEFSTKRDKYPADLEEGVYSQFLAGCLDVRERPETLNVLAHKDLWVNNIMFKYSGTTPTNAILIDFQCTGYAPPAFDLMVLLYLTTSRTFREEYEAKVLRYYFSTFMEYVDEAAKAKLRDLNYDFDTFLVQCEMARKFGMVEALTKFPFILMDADTARATFDDPETFAKYMEEDRSEPVIAHAHRCKRYKERQLELVEGFVERYLPSV